MKHSDRSRLGTIVTAMITPFDKRGLLDIAEAQRVARWLVDRGNDGLVLAGSTGEGQTLDRSERIALWAAVKAAVGDRAKIIANAGTNNTRESVACAQEAASAGADAILAVVPYYNKPPQSGMIKHFAAIAEATPELPVIVYNVPGRTAANMLPETLLELAKSYSNIAGVKESSGDLKQIATIAHQRPKHFVVFAGDDHLFLPSLAVGADGVVGVASHLCSLEYRRMHEAFLAGNAAEAAQIHGSLLPLMEALFATTSPIPVKWAMKQLGFRVGECRLPLDGMPQALAHRLRPLLAPFADAPAEELVGI